MILSLLFSVCFDFFRCVALCGRWPRSRGTIRISSSSSSARFVLGAFRVVLRGSFVDLNRSSDQMVIFPGFFLCYFWVYLSVSCSGVVLVVFRGGFQCFLLFCSLVRFAALLSLASCISFSHKETAMPVVRPQMGPTPHRPRTGSSWVAGLLLGVDPGTGWCAAGGGGGVGWASLRPFATS